MHPTVRNNKAIRRIANAPTAEQWNKWESAANIRGKILGVTLLSHPGLGAIVELETGIACNKNAYRVTVGQFPRFRIYGGFRYWRAATICQLQTLVLLVQILLQDGYAEGQVHPCTKL